MVSVNLLAVDFVYGGMTYTITSDPVGETPGTVTLKEGKDAGGTAISLAELTIPGSVEYNNANYKVTVIAKDAFKGNQNIVEVKISENVATISNAAFQNCSNLKLLDLPSTLTSIGDWAFNGCTHLVHVCCRATTPPTLGTTNPLPTHELITLYVPVPANESQEPYSKTSGWKDRFWKIYQGEMLKIVNDDSEYICASVSQVATLYAGKNVTEVTVPTNFVSGGTTYDVKCIGRAAFSGCKNITNLIIESGVETVCQYAFDNCEKLLKLEIPASLTSISTTGTFNGCKRLAHVCSRLNNPTSLVNVLPSLPNDYKLYMDVDEYIYNQYKNNSSLRAKFTGGIYWGQMSEVFDEASAMTYICATRSLEATLTVGKNEAVVSIPATFGNYQVKAIEKEAFKGMNQISELTIPEGLTSIGTYAFQDCSTLRKVVMPSSLIKIGENAFISCNGLVHVVSKSNDPQDINENVFPANTYSSGTLYVPSGTIDSYNNKTGWKNFVTILEGEMVEVNENSLTYVCVKKSESITYAILTKALSDVTNVTIPRSVRKDGVDYMVTTIASKAFQNCKALEKVVLPSTLTAIGDYAFDGCSKLIYVVSQIPNPLAISTNVFSNSTKATLFVPETGYENYSSTNGWRSFSRILKGDMGEVKVDDMNYVYATASRVAIMVNSETTGANVTVPSSISDKAVSYTVTEIEKLAFSGNSSLVNLTISENIEKIGDYAFKSCTNLKKVVLPSTLTSIGNGAFSGDYQNEQCRNISEIVSGIAAVKLFAIREDVFPSSIWSTATVYVPIGAAETYKTTDGWKKFSNYVEGDKLDAIVGEMTYLYLTGPKTATLISMNNETTVKDLVIPDSVLIGGVYYKVTAIDKDACKYITSAVSLKIGGNVQTIGANAFQSCTNLEKIEFPSSLKSIGEKAFDGCKNITHICAQMMNPSAFNKNVFSVYTPTLYVPEGKINSYKEINYWNNFSNIVEGYFVNELTKEGLTYDCLKKGSGETATKEATLTKSATATSDVVIPDSVAIGDVYYKVTTIGKSVFNNNSKLVNITIPECVKSIGDEAFGNCNNIKNIVSKIKVPFAINENVFSISTPTLYVPVGTRDQYRITSGWSKFTTVYEGLMKEKTINDITYYYATGDKTALLVSTTTTAKDVVIPDSFMVDGVYYKVIAIKESVFKDKTSIESLTLPSTLTQIGDNAFDGCKNIAVVTSKIKEPFTISDNVFSAYTAALYVPENSRAKYQTAPGWKNFANIFEGVQDEVTLDGMTYIYATGDKTATLIKTTLSEKDVTIPGSFKIGDVTYKVTAIDKSVFKDNKSLVNLKISENVKTIGACAFQGCSGLKRLELPSTLTDIGEKAFDGCKNLAHVCSQIKAPFDIDDNVFSKYSATLYVPDGTSGLYQARDGWKNFTNIMEGYFVEEKVFDDMTFICLKNGEGETLTTTATLTKASTSTSDVTIPSSFEIDKVTYLVTKIGKSAFSGNSKIKNLTLSENIKAIEENAFADCTNLEMITSMIKEPFDINPNVFYSYDMATLYVPDNTRSKYLTKTGWKNFATILEGVRNETTTGDGMTYYYATGDKTATLIKAKVSDKDVTVRGTFKLGDVTYTVTAIDNAVFKDNKSIVNLKIEENIKTIGANAFQNCANLEKVELPSTLKAIGESAFDNCTRLSHIVSRVKDPFAINDNVFEASIYPTAILYVPTVTSADYKTMAGWKNFTHILVGELKEVMADNLTYYCIQGPNIATLVKASTAAADVTVPSTVKDGNVTYKVTEISAYAFSGIGSLEKLTVSEGISTIGIGAYQNDSKLEKVVLPASLTSIGDYAFDKCSRLALVVSNSKTPTAISDNVFSDYTAKLNVPEGAGDMYRNTGGWNNFTVILEGDMLEAEVDGIDYLYITGSRTATLINGDTKESDLTVQSTVTINGVEYTVTAIGESAFANNSSIVSLTIPEGIKTIGDNAFRNCGYLNTLILPNSLTEIGENAFAKCDRLTHVESAIKNPSGISDNVFTATTYANATLYIPAQTTALYANAAGWKKFVTVLEGEMSEKTVDGMTYICVENLKTAKLIKGIPETKDVTIPSTITVDGVTYQVTDIDRSAFFGFGTIENLIVSEGIKKIGLTAFKNCYKLKTIELPSSLTSIGDYAFENCSRITLINNHGKKPVAISDNVFSTTTVTLYVPGGSAPLYRADACWGKFDIHEVASIKIGGKGKTTYCGDLSLDFSFSEELKAYVATGVDNDENIIWLTRVKDVPAGVPVMIKGEANQTYYVPVKAGKNSYYENMFVGNTSGEDLKIGETSEDGSKRNYYLTGGKFVSVKGYANIGNNKCYLQLPSTFEPVSPGESQTVQIAGTGKSSYAAPVDLDFTNVVGLKAFTATGYDKSSKTIWLTRVMKAQKGEGLLLKGEANEEYEIPSVGVQSSYGNMFVGNTTGDKITINETDDEGSLTNFYLSKGQFVSVKGYATIYNNKSYLQLPTEMVAAAASTRGIEDEFNVEEPEIIKVPVVLDLKFADVESGVLSPMQRMDPADDAYYNLQGQRVDKPGKGLYIKNGKKVVIR